MNIREKLLSLKTRKTQLINVERLGLCVIQSPDETKRAEIETHVKADTAKRLIVVHCLVDGVDLINPETGKERELNEVWLAEPAIPAMMKKDIDRMGIIDSSTVDDIASAAMKLMRMSQEDQNVLVGEPGKPSKTTPS